MLDIKLTSRFVSLGESAFADVSIFHIHSSQRGTSQAVIVYRSHIMGFMKFNTCTYTILGKTINQEKQ
jgi:hypothetical protein